MNDKIIQICLEIFRENESFQNALKKIKKYILEIQNVDFLNFIESKEYLEEKVNSKELLLKIFQKENELIYLNIFFKKEETEQNLDKYILFARSLQGSKRKYNRKLLSPDKLIKLIKEKGIFIQDETQTELFFKHFSYYKFKEFSYFFKENANFEDILNLFFKDKTLRIYFLQILENLEISIKTNFSKLLSFEDPFSYLNLSWCKSEFKRAISAKIHFKSKEFFKDMDNLSLNFSKNFKNKYNDFDIPLIMLVERLSLGEIYEMIYSSKENLQIELANIYSLDIKEFFNLLEIIREIRNCSAHNNMLILKNNLKENFEIIKNVFEKNFKSKYFEKDFENIKNIERILDTL